MSNHWRITVDHIGDRRLTPGTNGNAVGVASRGYLDGESLPVEFRAYDDDGELYYSGFMEEEDFQPLDDFCGPNAGCTALKCRRDNAEWETL